MKPHYKTSSHYLYLLFFMCFGYLGAQEQSIDIIDKYENYTATPRETVYLHLNKSTYIKGESIGFTAYVLDKKDKKRSLLTTNLYVSIEDANKNIIKKKLIRVDNGIASNTFIVDSLFNSGLYNIKAYTNWMRNFDEQNYHQEALRVIDPETEKYIEKVSVDNAIDAQFLPESGHLLNGVLNKVGVVIKDSQGFGVPNAVGQLIGNDNEILTTFKTNELGIGSFALLANLENAYKVKVNHANKDFIFSLGHKVEKNGVIISVKGLKSKLFASIITNQETLDIVKNKRYALMIHNGDAYKVIDIYFTDNTTVTKSIDCTTIPSGTNILTLFNEDEKPIAERLFFNYEGINIINSNDISATSKTDSLSIRLGLKDIDQKAFNNTSISILPQETRSYSRHSNIISQAFLQPYLKTSVEQSKYYFNNINDRKRHDLDNLLVTQGWSSYDWNNMFLPDELPYSFEQGIALKANVNNQKHINDVYVLHHFGNNQPQYKQVSDGNNSIIFENLFPSEKDSIYVSRSSDNEKLVPAQLYLQTLPSLIPSLVTNTKVLPPKSNYKITEELSLYSPRNLNLDEVQQLDEVVVESSVDKELVRARKLSAHLNDGFVKIPSETDKLTFLYLEDYLWANRINAFSFSIESREGPGADGRVEASGNDNSGMLIILDGVPLASNSVLYKYPMANIDYIEFDRNGARYGARGGKNGVLKIYSSFKSMFSSVNKVTAQNYKIPLTFSADKKFYTPKYQYYNDDFFKGFGTIDWKPKLAIDDKGNITFKILKPEVPITLFIEGIANDGSFIFEEKSITLN
ncbi:hypothetical protein [Winogradskyella sp. R77965]|uniref:hypothetical protein n=1 Tax=Winogradskyella sp. R77965 TaxID=3093872 RepID=UPI0037DDD5EB